MSEIIINEVITTVDLTVTEIITTQTIVINEAYGILEVVAGTNVTVDNTNPLRPVVSASGGGAVDSVNGQTGTVVLDTSDIEPTTDRNYQTDDQNEFNDFTSSGQTQINGKLSKWQSGVDGVTIANTTTAGITYSKLIPANTIVAGDVINVEFRATYGGSKNSSSALLIFVNTVNDLSSATQVGLYNTNPTTARTGNLKRNLSVKTSTLTKVANPTQSSVDDDGLTGALSSLSIDWTVDQYFLFVIKHSVDDQFLFGDFYKITK